MGLQNLYTPDYVVFQHSRKREACAEYRAIRVRFEHGISSAIS